MSEQLLIKILIIAGLKITGDGFLSRINVVLKDSWFFYKIMYVI